MLNVDQIFVYRSAVLMYKVMNDSYPQFLSSMFTYNANVHDYNTRHTKFLHIPLLNKTSSHRSFKITGLRIWNLILSHIDVSSGIGKFKSDLKQFIVAHPNLIIHALK